MAGDWKQNRQSTSSIAEIYAKGKGASFLSWVIEKYPNRAVYVLYRADLGTRLDSTTEAALALYMNRELYLEFLHERIAAAKEENKLENALYILLSSNEIIAAIRVRAMFHLKVTMPMRFLTNSNDLNFSPADMGPVVDALYKFLDVAENNGDKLVDVNLNIFRDVLADGTEAHSAFASWQKDFMDTTGSSIGGTVKRIPIWRLAVNEVFDPSDAVNKSTGALVIPLIQEWAKGMKEGMLETPQREHLSECEGVYSESHITERARSDLAGSDTSNDLSERAFAIFTAFKERFRNVGWANASAQAAGAINHHVVGAAPKTAGHAKVPPLIFFFLIRNIVLILNPARLIRVPEVRTRPKRSVPSSTLFQRMSVPRCLSSRDWARRR